jgi:predicted transcriptional regulator YdeE
VIDLEVNIVEKASIKIVGMSISTLLQDVGNTGPAMYARLEERKNEIIGRINPAMDYAVSIDPPNYNVDTDDFKLMIGVEVDSFDRIPREMESLELSSSKYACVIKTDDSTFGYLIRWVNESHYELADTYSIEVHDNTLESVVLMFPIQKKNVEK